MLFRMVHKPRESEPCKDLFFIVKVFNHSRQECLDER